MPTQSFLSARERGRIGQTIVQQKLEKTGWKVDMVKDGYFRAWDFIADNGQIRFSGEIKYDEMSDTTGNICLELEAIEHSKAQILVYVFPDKSAYIMPVEDALNYAKAYPVKKRVGEFKGQAAIVPKYIFLNQKFLKPI